MRTDPINLSPAEMLVIFGYHWDLDLYSPVDDLKNIRAKVGIDESDDITISLATKHEQWYNYWAEIRKKTSQEPC